MSESEQSGAGRREVAYRIFAAEFETADFSYSESDEERAPSYVITPTGARANRLFLVGVLTEVEQVSEDVLRGRVVDPTGAFVLYAGQYQPDEQAFLERAEPPTFVAVTGKARTFQPEDSDQVFTSIRPESISEVDAETRDRWTVQAAEHTHRRISWMARALALDDGEPIRETLGAEGADDGLAHGIELAIQHYDPTPSYLHSVREMALDAARVVAGEKDEVDGETRAPGQQGEISVAELLAAVGSDSPPESVISGTSTEDSPTQTSPTTESSGEEPSTEELSAEEPSTADKSSIEPSTAEGEGTTTADESAESVPTETTTTTTEPETSTADSGLQDEKDITETDSSSVAESAPSSTEAESKTASETSTDGPSEADSSTDTDPETVEESDPEDLGDFDPGEFELEEETREEIEQEYGTEFQSGTEVDEPGEAGIETPDPEEQPADEQDTPADSNSAASTESEPSEPAVEPDSTASTTETAESTQSAQPEDSEGVDSKAEADGAVAETTESETGETDEKEADQPEDLQAAVVELMSELDAGDGADREDLIAEMDARYGTDRETVEEAIQDALMDGQCYEPDDTLLKPI